MYLNSFLFVMVAVALSLASCRGGGDVRSLDEDEGKSLLCHTDRLILLEHPDGWYEAKVINPWDTTTLLQRVALVPRNIDISNLTLPEGITLVRTPLERSHVTSTVHVGLIEEIGGGEAIAGVADAEYIKSSDVLNRLEKGDVVACGGWLSPDIEKIIKLSPDAILLSPYQNGGTYGHITELGIPVIYVADYMEKDPLGRAEWLKYYGLLYGKETVADSIFNRVEKKYLNLRDLCKQNATIMGSKKVLMDIPYSGTWQVPSEGSTNDYFIKEAGGLNPFSTLKGDQFVGISTEKALFEAKDADVWIIRQNSASKLSLEQLKKDFPFAPQFDAFRKQNVWACNTNESLYFEETPFHPERILEDLYRILYDPAVTDSLNYFNRLR